MSELSNTVATGFSNAFRDYARRARALAEPLSNDQFWTRPYPYGNSFGHLVLHITGNLSYYIGTQMANTGYVRDRDREFTDTNPPSKENVLQHLDDVVEMVAKTIEAQSEADWSLPYSAVGADGLNDRFAMILRCVSHFHHHLGQMIYLVKESTK